MIIRTPRRLTPVWMRTAIVALCAVEVLAVTTACAAPTAENSTPAWTPTGWGGGGFYYSAAYHPTRDGVILLGMDVAGVAKSTDHGKTFRMVNTGLVDYGVYSLAIDVMNSDIAYAATEGGLHKSTDGGETWKHIPKTGKKELRITGERYNSVRAIASDPSDSSIVYAASPGGKIYKSTDGAMTWRVVHQANAGAICSVSVSGIRPERVVAATELHGLVLSEDKGETWHALPSPAKAFHAMFDPSDDDVIYGAFGTDGVHKSTDKGATWKKISAGLDANFKAREVAVSPANPRDVYLIGAIGWSGGFYYSNDAGETWVRSTTLKPDHAANPTLPDEGAIAALSVPTNIALSPVDPKKLYLSVNWRPVHSSDGGKTWEERVKGADITVQTDIRFSGDRVYVSAMDEGAFVSEDQGKSWKALWPRAYNRELSGHNWRLAVTRINGVDRIIATGTPWDGKDAQFVVISEDGGKTFKTTTEGLPTYKITANTMWGRGYPRALAVDPSDPKIVYLGIDGDPTEGKTGGGVFKSLDGGYTWKQLPNQPGSRRVYYGLAIDPTDPRRILWGACGDEGGVHLSEDGGDSWTRVLKQDMWIFNVHATKDGTLYAGGNNLWRSTDHGKTWTQLTQIKGRSVVGIEVDPRDGNTIWISAVNWDGSSKGDVFKSTDGGATWENFTGNLMHRKPQILRFNPKTNELWSGQTTLNKIQQ